MQIIIQIYLGARCGKRPEYQLQRDTLCTAAAGNRNLCAKRIALKNKYFQRNKHNFGRESDKNTGSQASQPTNDILQV